MHYRSRRPAAQLALALVLTAAALAAPSPVAAQQKASTSLRANTSLGFVPADAALYVSMLHSRRQYEDLVGSRAFQKLSQLPAVQMAVMMAQFQWNNPQDELLAAVKEFLEAEENRPLIDLVLDALSHEIFFYAGPECGKQLALFNQFNQTANLVQIEALSSGESADTILTRRILDLLKEHADDIRVPKLILGFRVTDVARAQSQLDRLESLLKEALAEAPDIRDRFSRQDRAGTRWLTLQLDGSLLPWDEITLDDAELDDDQRAEAEKLFETLKKKKLALALGVWNEYLLLVVGEENHAAETLNKARLLIDRKELAPLDDAGQRVFTSVGYMSDAFAAHANQIDRQVDYLVDLAKRLLPLASMPQALETELAGDLGQLGEDLKRLLPVPGAVMGYEYRTGRGYAGVTHNWSRRVGLDGSKRLTILDHLGGHPLFFVAARRIASPDGYARLVHWIRRAAYYTEKLALPALDDVQRERYEKLRPRFSAIAGKLDTTIRQQLQPALADRQRAIVLSASATSRQWHAALPASDSPLPMLELAVAHGLSDARQFGKACEACFQIAQETVDSLHEALPDDVPKIDLPRPASDEVDGGWIHSYPLPAAWGFDPQIAPNLGWSDDVAVCSLLPDRTRRMLKKRPFEAEGPLAECDRPLAVAVYCDVAGLIEVVGDWIDYGVLQAGGNEDPQAADSAQGWLDQIHTVLNVLECFRGYSSATVMEDDVMVTRYEWHFEDLQ